MTKNLKNNFVDYIKIYCKSGNGGKGSAHFFRSRIQTKGGPDGGGGGHGGGGHGRAIFKDTLNDSKVL